MNLEDFKKYGFIKISNLLNKKKCLELYNHLKDFSNEILKGCLNQAVLLLGSAPVGQVTTSRLIKYANRLPTVRFGSTETTLQGDIIYSYSYSYI